MTADPIAALKDQLRQIDTLAASGALSSEAAASARAELERRLVDAVMAAPAAAAAAPSVAPAARLPRRTLVAMVGIVLVFGALVYGWRGNWQAWSVAPGTPAPATPAPATPAPSK